MVWADEVGGDRLRGEQYQVQVEDGAGIGVEEIDEVEGCEGYNGQK